jgi:hypothetical protein
MASADAGGAPHGDAAGGTLSLLAALQRDATGPVRRRQGPAGEPDRRLWSAFGSAATDRQRINLKIRLPGEDAVRFFHAADVLAAAGLGSTGDTRGSDPLPGLAPVLCAALEAAESTLPWHRARLYLGPGSAPVRAREDCVVLEWKRSIVPGAPAMEVIRADDFTGGRWSGPRRRDDPRYLLAAQSMMAACASLHALMRQVRQAGACVAASIRTFERA